MERLDTKLVNGTLATSEGVMRADIAIAEGKITAIGRTGSLPDAKEVIDIKGKVVLPGGIDTHVHSGDPVRARHEFAVCTLAREAHRSVPTRIWRSMT